MNIKEQIARALDATMPDPGSKIDKVVVYFSVRKNKKKSSEYTLLQQVSHEDYDNFFKIEWKKGDSQFKNFREHVFSLTKNSDIYYAKVDYMQGSIPLWETTIKGVADKVNKKQSKIITFSK